MLKKKMKAFKLNLFIFESYGICDTNPPTGWSERLGRRIMFYIIVTIIILSIISSTVYVHKFVKTDLVGSLFAIFQIAGGVSIASAMTVVYINRHKLGEIFSEFHQIHGNLRTQRKCTHILKIFFFYFHRQN